MNWTTEQLLTLTKEALALTHSTLSELGKNAKDEREGKFVGDIVTSGDVAISEKLIQFFKEKGVPAIIWSEESEIIKLTEDPQFIISFDDIDGTDNFFRGENALPYCTILSIFDNTQPTFNDALVAGILVHNTNDIWHAVRGEGTYLNDKSVFTSKKTTLGREERALLVVDHHGSGGVISPLFKHYIDFWVKDFGCTGMHLAGISSGMFDVFVNASIKSYEVGAGYLLITEAGGLITDFEGNELKNKQYEFNKTYQFIAAGNKELLKEILEKLH
jgi:myo-inositol-1(or 4)-monophosphatase